MSNSGPQRAVRNRANSRSFPKASAGWYRSLAERRKSPLATMSPAPSHTPAPGTSSNARYPAMAAPTSWR